jgi:hypothetical protein
LILELEAGCLASDCSLPPFLHTNSLKQSVTASFQTLSIYAIQLWHSLELYNIQCWKVLLINLDTASVSCSNCLSLLVHYSFSSFFYQHLFMCIVSYQLLCGSYFCCALFASLICPSHTIFPCLKINLDIIDCFERIYVSKLSLCSEQNIWHLLLLW